MGLLDSLKGMFPNNGKLTEKGATTDPNNQLYRALYSMLLNNNVEFYDQKIETFIEKGYMFNPHAYTVINFIARSISQVPFKVYEVKNKKNLQKYIVEKSKNNVAYQNLYKEKALEEVDGGTLHKIMKHPNDNQGMAEFLFEAIGYKKLTGNRFIYGLTPSGFDKDLFTKMYNMPSQMTEIILGDWMQPVKGYKLNLTNDRKLDIECARVLHQKEWNPQMHNGTNPYGLSPMEPLLRSLQRSNESYDASLGLMKNGIPAGILSNNSDLVMTPDMVDKMESAYKNKFGGGKNKNKVLFSAANVSWQEIGMKSQDMELLASNMSDLRDFCRVYAIPTMLVSDTENSTFNNVTEAKKSVWMENFIPELDQIRDGFNNWLVPAHSKKDGKEYFVDYDLTAVPVLQTDLDKLSARLMKEMEQGMWSANEVRAMLGREQGNTPHLDKFILGSRFDFIDKDGMREERPTSVVNREQGKLVENEGEQNK
jgi:HK97 family phage portal protein